MIPLKSCPSNLLWDTECMSNSPPTSGEIGAPNDPKSVRVDMTGGTGLRIAWKDGHESQYSFPFLRDACPCALCDAEREKSGRKPGEPAKLPAGALPMFKEKARPSHTEPVGRYALRFNWNDGHDLGIYSWPFLREYCPCEACRSEREATK
jgi:DUF971 family protein